MHKTQQLTPYELFRCATPVQLRYSDFDMHAHVNNGVYPQLLDLGKADYFARVYPDHGNHRATNVVIAQLNITFAAPVLPGEHIEVYTRTTTVGNSSFTLEQQIRNRDTHQLKCHATTIMVHVDIHTAAAVPLPDVWRHALTGYEQQQLPPKSD